MRTMCIPAAVVVAAAAAAAAAVKSFGADAAEAAACACWAFAESFGSWFFSDENLFTNASRIFTLHGVSESK